MRYGDEMMTEKANRETRCHPGLPKKKEVGRQLPLSEGYEQGREQTESCGSRRSPFSGNPCHNVKTDLFFSMSDRFAESG